MSANPFTCRTPNPLVKRRFVKRRSERMIIFVAQEKVNGKIQESLVDKFNSGLVESDQSATLARLTNEEIVITIIRVGIKCPDSCTDIRM